jgi:hypothetical protein
MPRRGKSLVAPPGLFGVVRAVGTQDWGFEKIRTVIVLSHWTMNPKHFLRHSVYLTGARVYDFEAAFG